MRKIWVLAAFAGLLALSATAGANTVTSSTMWFKGTLTDAGGGVYTGTLAMVDESVEGVGDGIAGFDVYAKQGGTAYVEGMSPDNWVIGSDHDAYSQSGPWGTWYDPDCADWNAYSLELTADHWYLRYTSTQESPMSGTMNWAARKACETDLGTQERPSGYPPHGRTDNSANYGGGAGAWDWQNGWGVEVIPLQHSCFAVDVTDLGNDQYLVSLTPVPEPISMLLFGGSVLGGLGAWRRRRV